MLNGNQTELARKEANLIDRIEKMLPDFARACRARDNIVVTCIKMPSLSITRKRSMAPWHGDNVRGHLRQRNPDRRNEQANC